MMSLRHPVATVIDQIMPTYFVFLLRDQVPENRKYCWRFHLINKLNRAIVIGSIPRS
jgi:hypothetical protein